MLPEDAYDANHEKIRNWVKKASQLQQINDFAADTAKRQIENIKSLTNGFPFDILAEDQKNFKIPQPLNERDKIMFAAGQLSLALFIQGATQ